MATFYSVVLLCLVVLVGMVGATQFTVGGSKGWSVPDSYSTSYKPWAESNRFQIGDTLLFVYPPDQDSVLQVDKDAYDKCNTTSYIAKYDDGHTVVQLNQSGPFYFISGNEANCKQGEALTIVVLADRSDNSSSTTPSANQPSLPPSPPPTPSSTPPAPEESASPPPPEESVSSPPPPSGSEEGTAPAVAPSTEEASPPPPPAETNGAIAKSLSYVSSFVALFCAIFMQFVF